MTNNELTLAQLMRAMINYDVRLLCLRHGG